MINKPLMKVYHTLLFRISIVIFSMVAFIAQAQITQPARYEREHNGREEDFTVLSLKDEGLALLHEKDKYNGNKRVWELILLDTGLREKSIVNFDVRETHPLVGYEYVRRHLFLLYRQGETNKNSLDLIDVDLNQGIEVGRYEIKTDLDFKLSHFSKVGNSIVLGGYVTNEPAVLLYDVQKNSVKIVPGFFQKDTELVDLRVNENQTFNTLLIDRSLRAERTLVFKTYDETGKLLLDDIIPIDEDKSLQTSISSTLQREDMLILGTWGDKQGKQAYGFFSIPVDPFNAQKINYHYFGQLSHFTDHLSAKRAQKIKDRTKEDVQNGRRPSYTSYVFPFRVDEHPEGFIMLAEVYNPSAMVNPYYSSPYSNPNYANPYTYNPYWPSYYPGMRMYRPYSYNNAPRNTDDIKTYETVVAAFNPNGKLLWDYSLKLDEINRPSLEQVSDYYFTKNKVFFAYRKESDLKFKVINTDDGTAEESSQKIMLNDPSSEIRSEKEMLGGVRSWVGNSFYVWGYQTIKNHSKGGRANEVFYVNKIVVR